MQMLQQSDDSTDILHSKLSKLNTDSMKNVTTDSVILTDRKRPKEEAVATKTFKYYDVLTGKETERKVNFQDKKKLKEKNMHQAMTERKP